MNSKNPVTMNSFLIKAPSSKSEFQREVAIALLCDQPSTILFNSLSDDSLTALRLADELGTLNVNAFFYNRFKNFEPTSFQPINSEYLANLYSDFKINPKIGIDDAKEFVVRISGNNNQFFSLINCGESGLALHLFAGILSAQGKQFTLTGCGTLINRYQNDLINSLKYIGLEVSHNNNKLPISISGTINKTTVRFDKFSGSQTLSALLLAYSKLGKEAKIVVKDLQSRNYVSMTIQALARHNIEIENDGYTVFRIKPNQLLEAAEVQIEGCWSSASFWFVLGAIGGGIEVTGLQADSLQPDRAILTALESCGANFKFEQGNYCIDKSNQILSAFTFDATNCPDLIPNLVILAAHCDGESQIIGVNRLENKESNRAKAILDEFSKIGVDITRNDNIFIIRKSTFNDAIVSSHSDHRITMALELAAAISRNNIQIDETKNVSKSYPEFYKDLENWKIYLSESI